MVGAAAPAMIRTAARVADRVDLQPDALRGGGANLADYNSYTYELLAVGAERALAEASLAGRSIRVSASPFVLVTSDETEGAEARQTMADFLGLDPSVLEVSFGTLIGSPDEVAAKLARYEDAGCDRVHLQALNAEAATRIAPLLPALREA
jgi:alkanesulfonate monooxygenase SsuD/methylene tetrahydromethanopterin reductase-like flavin-dependent oxidoreductase (luciferase family)